MKKAEPNLFNWVKVHALFSLFNLNDDPHQTSILQFLVIFFELWVGLVL